MGWLEDFKKAHRAGSAITPEITKDSFPENEDVYLDDLYKRIVEYCKEQNLPPPSRGIVDKTKMHVCRFEPTDGWRNGNFYAYLGTYACMPVPKGTDYRDVLMNKSFFFPIHTNVGACGAVVIPFLKKEGKFLLMKEWRTPIGRFSYNFPRGFSEKVENTISTAIREVKEEAGVKISIGDCVPLGRIFENNGCSYNAPEIYYCEIAGDVQLKPEKMASCVLMNEDEIFAGIEAGNKGDDDGIVDSFTLSALMKLMVRLASNGGDE